MFMIAICDDNQAVCANLEQSLIDYCVETGQQVQTEVFYSGNSLCNAFENGYTFDLIFLDIEMEGLTGLDVSRRIRSVFKDEMTEIVFISGNTGYALELFKISPLDFLVKPLKEEEIKNVTERAMRRRVAGNVLFHYKQGKDAQKCFIKDILYFESRGRSVRMVTVDGDIEFKGKIRDIVKTLEKSNFLLIHKSYLVNYFHTREVKFEQLTMSNGEVLAISQSNRKAIRDKLFEYSREK